MYKEYASKQFVEEYFKNQDISSVSTPDWNENDESSSSYIKNRPFYNKTQYTKKYEVDITFTDSRTVNDLDLWINEGNFYRIEFNGVAFEAVGVELGFFHNKVGDVNNNPIEIECYEIIGEGSGRYCWVKLSDNYELGTYSLVVYEGIPDIVTIPEYFLPKLVGRATPEGGEIFNDYKRNQATGLYSHAEGRFTEAAKESAHAEGYYSIATGFASHAEGQSTTASGNYSHAEGDSTIANSKSQHTQGEYNVLDTENISARGIYAHIVGNGTAYDARSNAHTLDWSGNAWFAGDVYVGSTSGTNKDDGSIKLATVADLEAAIGTAIGGSY